MAERILGMARECTGPKGGQHMHPENQSHPMWGLSRREFLKRAGLVAAAAAGGPSLLAACSGTTGGSKQSKQLKILQWSHFVPSYDQWFDPFAKKWGTDHGIKVTVDHINNADIPARTAAEITGKSGHDLIEWIIPPSVLEPSVVDVTDIVQEAEQKYGQQFEFCKLTSFNPTTNKYYGFCHTWTPDPGDYRKSLWEKVGMPNGPTTWDELLAGGTEINQGQKVPMGIGMSQEVDSNMAARALIWSFGGSVQDANENVVINSPQVIDAVAYMVKLFRQSMTNEVFSWTAASNNQGLIAGELSYILNSISAYRSAETSNPDVAGDVFFVPALKGPGGQALASEHVVKSYVIPTFSKNVDTAKQFLLNLVANSKDVTNNSQLYDFPAFKNEAAAPLLPGWLQNDPFKSQPANKLALLATAEQWSTNVGYPGPANAAESEVFNTFILPNMMASAVRGQASPQQAVANAESQIKPIFDKWRKQGLVGGTS
jgi:multiple sugar transport system substrate-binding protein